MNLKYISLCLLFCVIVPFGSINAQTDLEQQQRQQDLRDRIEQQKKQHQPIEIQPSPSSDTIPTGSCFDISSITLDGAKHLPSNTQQSLIAPFINQCIDLNKINQLLEAISNWYFEQGNVTSRAYVTAQDLSSGHFLITVVEGSIESIKLNDPDIRIKN